MSHVKRKASSVLNFWIYLLILLNVILPSNQFVSSTNYFKCPNECQCSTTTINSINEQSMKLIHAKCSSVQSLLSADENFSNSLYSLDLSYSKNLTQIPRNLIKKFKNLNKLDVAHNNLSEINNEIFLNQHLQHFNASHNRITSKNLHNLLAFAMNLRSLDLSYNHITYLPYRLRILKNLKEIELFENNLDCSCGTLKIRNWIQQNNVKISNNQIECKSPLKFKDKLWYYVKQSDVCTSSGTANENHHKSVEIQKSSDKDQKMKSIVNVSASSDDKESLEELGNDYLPISNYHSKKRISLLLSTPKSNKIRREVLDVEDAEVEGSGNGDQPDSISGHENLVSDTESNDQDEDSKISSTEPTDIRAFDAGEDIEGSGGEFPSEHAQFSLVDDGDDTSNKFGLITSTTISSTSENNDDDEHTSTLASNPFMESGLGIFDFSTTSTTTPATTTTLESEISPSSTAVDEIIPPKIQISKTGNAPDIESSSQQTDIIEEASDKENISQAKTSDSNSAYILLGIILVILILLIVFVGVKKARAKRNSRSEDITHPKSQELVDMDKKNLGKPKLPQHQRNGNSLHENVPLINERNKITPIANSNGKTYDKSNHDDKTAQEPLLTKHESNKSPEAAPRKINESNNNTIPSQPIDTTDHQVPPPSVTPTPATRHHIPAYPPPRSKTPTNETAYQASSPRPSRYSPVYSPETGRVKIKLTETPKPKTPILVTRSKSSAGDIITTPITPIRPTSAEQ